MSSNIVNAKLMIEIKFYCVNERVREGDKSNNFVKEFVFGLFFEEIIIIIQVQLANKYLNKY